MPVSYAYDYVMECPNCHRSVHADLWVVVDASERPDLVARLCTGELHTLHCSSCRFSTTLDIPMLVYQPDARPHLLYSAARHANEEEGQEQINQLMNTLAVGLGDRWQDAWLDEMMLLTRPFLKAILRERDLAPMIAPLGVLVSAPTWDERQRIVEQRPELLTETADRALARFVAASQEDADPDAVALYAEYRALLRRCREVGASRAFAEQMAATKDSTESSQPDVQSATATLHPDVEAHMQQEFREIFEILTQSGIDIRSMADFEKALNERPELAQRFRRAAHMGNDGPDTPPEFAADVSAAEEAMARFTHSDDLGALDTAVTIWSHIMSRPTFGSTDQAFQLEVINQAATTHYRRFGVHGHEVDLDRALSLWHRAMSEALAGSQSSLTYLNNFGLALHTRFKRTGNNAELDRVIRIQRQILALAPNHAPDFASYLSNLANSLRARYVQTGQGADRYLDEAIQHCRQAVNLTPTASSDLPKHLSILANGLRDRYEQKGRIEDLNEAIDLYAQAVDRLAPNSPDQAALLNNLGAGLRSRYARFGRETDLGNAINAFQRAVEATPSGSPDLPNHLNSLGNGLIARYTRTGRVTELEAAIRTFRQAVDATPPRSSALPNYLQNLGNGLKDRYVRFEQERDLEEAAELLRTAGRITPPNSIGLPGCLNNLGNILRTRYHSRGDDADLEEAMSIYRRSVELTPSESPDRPMRLNNLATVHLDRYMEQRNATDLDEAIRLIQLAIDGATLGSPDLPMYHNNLGNGLRDRYAASRHEADRSAARENYRRALELGQDMAIEMAMQAARNWAGWAVDLGDWEDVVEAASAGVSVLDRLFAVQMGRDDQESALRQGRKLAARLAFALARLGRIEEAVEAIEQGRARLLSEALAQSRTDLDRLVKLGHQPLYERYHTLLERRESLMRVAAMSATGGVTVDAAHASERLAALNEIFGELEVVIAEIQRIPEYEGFLAKPTFEQIQTALMRTGAFQAAGVYLVATEAGGVALIVSASGVQSVWLDEVVDEEVRAWLLGGEEDPAPSGWLGAYFGIRDSGSRVAFSAWLEKMDDVTRVLWTSIMGPLAAALNRLSPVVGNGEAHVWTITVIPSGLLALLPLHAAWTEDAATPTGRRYFLDEFAIRYAPSAMVFDYACKAADQANVATLLAVDEPKPVVSGGPLPNAASEVDAIAGHFSQPVLYRREQAYEQVVRAALPAADVIHFSCHGTNDWTNPLESGLLMAREQLLTVHDLLGLRLTPKRLATLSACETGIVGISLPNEAVMLPSALLQAGYAGVVASLWSVADVSTAMLMTRFYAAWLDEGMEPVQALRIAQCWVRDTTNAEKAAYFRKDIPTRRGGLRLPAGVAKNFFKQVRSKPDQDARDFAHPFWWAAFTLTGV